MRTITKIKTEYGDITIQKGMGTCNGCGSDTGDKWYCFEGFKYHKECLPEKIKKIPGMNKKTVPEYKIGDHMPNGNILIARLGHQTDPEAWIILSMIPDGGQPFVTHQADNFMSTYWGHYYSNIYKAAGDLYKRAGMDPEKWTLPEYNYEEEAAPITREDYMSGKVSHDQYYRYMAGIHHIAINEGDLKLFGLSGIEDLQARFEIDSNLNNIPLMLFDNLTCSYNGHNPGKRLTLAEGCCIYKTLLKKMIGK